MNKMWGTRMGALTIFLAVAHILTLHTIISSSASRFVGIVLVWLIIFDVSLLVVLAKSRLTLID